MLSRRGLDRSKRLLFLLLTVGAAMAPLHREGCACDGEGGASCEQGWQSLKNGRFDRAIAQFTAAIQAGSKDAGAYYGRGLAHVKNSRMIFRGRSRTSRKPFGFSLATVDHTLIADRRIWNWAIRNGPFPTTMKPFESTPGTQPLTMAGARVYFRKHEFEKAISDFSIAIRIDPAKASFFSSRGLAYKRINNLTKALADYNETIRLEPNNTDAYIELGNVHSSLGSWDEAAADFDKAIRLRPNSPGLYEARGVSWINCNDYERGSAEHQDCNSA